MMASMIDFPHAEKSVLVVIIEADNLKRMEKGDPITLESIRAGGILPAPEYPQNFSILVAYEADEVELYKRAMLGGPQFLAWLERGREWIPGKDGVGFAFRVPKVEGKDG